MIYKVFVSSTYADLIDHREAVSLHLRKAGYHPLEMETMGARDQEPREACLKDVAKADLFVGIYAWRYGFVPQGSAVSITEQELLAAELRDKPILCFLINEKQEWPAERKEGGEGARRLDEFKRRIRGQRVVDSFTTPDDLAAKVVAAIARQRESEVAAPPASPERAILRPLLANVKLFWFDRVLKPAVPDGWWLHIEREERPEDVDRPVVAEWRPEIAAGQTGDPRHDFLNRQNRKLLFLGEPGSGKTIALLELARDLAEDPSLPVPVVFNLASWERDCPRLEDWMAQELRKQYGANEEEAEWIKKYNQQILPLLDGLDEVAADARSSCVTAINAHLKDRGITNPGMVVSCHSQVYQELPRLHRLDTAVVLHPLTPTQVDQHLADAGPAFSGLRAALSKDADLRELASTPLMVYLLKTIFEGATPTDIPPGLATNRGARLWEYFVEHMLKPPRPPRPADNEEPRPPSKGRFSPQATRRSLAWLAQVMYRHNRALFKIERLQPDWLLLTHDRFFGPIAVYSLLYHMAGGVLLTLPLALSTGQVSFAGAGLLAGLLVGALEIPRLLRQAPRTGGTRAIVRRAFFRTLYLGGLTSLLLVLLGLLWLWFRPSGVSRHELLASAVLVGLLTGAVFGSHVAVRSGKREIRVTEKLRWRRWSWRGSMFGAGYALLASLAFWGLYLISRSRTGFGPEFWIPFSAIVSLLGAVLFGAFGGLGRKGLTEKSRPNQGTWRTLYNAGFVALLMALVATSVLELALALVDLAQKLEGETPIRAFNAGNALALLKAGTALGFWAGLGYSGLDFLQHFSLRLVLGIYGLMPLRLVPFLKHAVHRGLMQGSGSYKFFHTQLRDWFAERYEAEFKRIE